MKVLALEPYYGGSHQAFLEGWIRFSSHNWTVLKLPAHHWKWRMRHSAVTFAEQVRTLPDCSFDAIFCSEMLSLATFLGLAPVSLRNAKPIVYFHENQLTYPDEFRTQRDHHFVFDHVLSILAADQVWFNSAWHLHQFRTACGDFLKHLPDYQLDQTFDQAMSQALVARPGLPEINSSPRLLNLSHPHIVWAGRWEKDKNPDTFFCAMRELKHRGIPFRLSVLGQSFRDSPTVFRTAEIEFANEIVHWGFLPSQQDYLSVLRETDLFVSTAIHEFFGIAAAEAIASGNLSLLPNRLAYPELLGNPTNSQLLYDGTVQGLTDHIVALTSVSTFAQQASDEAVLVQRTLTENLPWSILANEYDGWLEQV